MDSYQTQNERHLLYLCDGNFRLHCRDPLRQLTLHDLNVPKIFESA